MNLITKRTTKFFYKLFSFVLIAGTFLLPLTAFATTVVFTTSGTWMVPAGVTSVTADVWAGGGGGGSGSGGGAGAGGGGGGAFSEQTAITVVPGNVYSLTVGLGGAGQPFLGSVGNGGDSMFLSSTTVLAKGGSGSSGASGAPGGAAASGVGTTKHSGGAGGSDGSSCAAGASGGGGGGAGTTGDGGAGSNSSGGPSTCTGGVGGTGTSVGGGNGATGPSQPGGTGGTSPSTDGGGGSGPGGGSTGQNGARGEVDLTFTAASSAVHATVVQTEGAQVQMKGVYIQL